MSDLVNKLLEGADVRETLCETSLEDLDQFGDLVISASTVFQNKHNLVNVKAFEKEGKFAVEFELSNKAYADLIGAIETALKDAGFVRAYSSSSNNGPLTVFFDKKEAK